MVMVTGLVISMAIMTMAVLVVVTNIIIQWLTTSAEPRVLWNIN